MSLGTAAASLPTAAAVAAVPATDWEAEIKVPPPSPLNPVPSLPAALRVCNYEQLVTLLSTDPRTNSNNAPFSQWLVFGSTSLRTLLLRQVLSDPHTRSWKHTPKKNWDPIDTFPWPKRTPLIIAGTHVLESTSMALLSNNKNHTTTSPPTHDARVEDSGGGGSSSTSSLGSGSGNPANKIQNKSLLPKHATNVDVVTYFLRPADLSHTQQAVRAINEWKRQFDNKSSNNKQSGKGSTTTHHRLVFLPQPDALVTKVLHSLGISQSSPPAHISIHALPLQVFPLETDVLSLEYEGAWRQAELEGRPSAVVTAVARALLHMQQGVGPIPRIQSYGPLAEDVLRKLLSLTVDDYLAVKSEDDDAGHVPSVAPPGAGPVVGGSIDALLLMDRKVDCVTPMLTPLTYEGLLDDVVGIDCGFIHVPVSTINPEDDTEMEKGSGHSSSKKEDANEMVALGVNGSDSLYAEVRNQHVEQFGQFLQNQAMALRESHANFTSKGKHKDLSEIHQFVKQIPVFTQNLRSLTNHIHLAEWVKRTSETTSFRERWQTERAILEGETCYDFLEDLVASQHPPLRFFRLLCLQSLCAGVIKSSRYDSLRRDVVQTYGYEYLFVLQNMEKMGLLRRREGLWMDTASPFAHLRKALVLIHAEVDTVHPDDIAYVSSGYAPLSVRLVQTAIQGWTNREDVLRELPGRCLDIVQQCPPEDLTMALKRPAPPQLIPTVNNNNSSNNNEGGSRAKPTLMVLYIGGITFMEIAALRFLSKRPSFPYHILIVTTQVINGSQLLQSVSY
jgi:vacuolar protein sorting-associated protein 33A